MNSTLAFAAGFAAGWLTRGRLDSSRSLVVEFLAFGLDTIERVKRAITIEIERLEDLAAEAQHAVARRRAERAAERADGQPVEHAA